MSNHPTYELLEEIGSGSDAIVYRARDMALKRYVAVKELRRESRSDPKRLERFLEEARFLAGLRHENIVQVHGVDPERGWIIMELMQGGVDARMARGPLPAEVVRGVLRQVLQGLGYLHARGRLHGAVKPSNLLIDDEGRVKLSDSTGMIPSGEIQRPRGTPKYIAPELVNPEFGPVGPGVDLYAAGFAMLELLAGPGFDRHFRGAGPDAADPALGWLRWHGSAAESPPPSRQIAPNVPDDLARVLDRLVVKSVAGRYPNAETALKDLEDRPIPLFGVQPPPDPAATSARGPRQPTRVEYLTEAPPPGRAPDAKPAGNATTRPRKPSERSRGAAHAPWSRAWINAKLEKPYVLYPLCGAIVLGALALAFWPAPRPKPEPRIAAKKEAKPKRENQDADRSSKETEPKVVTKRPDDDKKSETRQDQTKIPPVVEPPKPIKPDALAALGVGESLVYRGHTNWVRAVAFSTDARRVVSGGDDSIIRLWDAETREEIRRFEGHQAPIHFVAFSGDGASLLSVSERGPLEFDLATGRPRPQAAPRAEEEGRRTCAAFSAEGARWLVGYADGRVRFAEASDESPTFWPGHEKAVLVVAISTDGAVGASGGEDRTVRLWDLKARRALGVVKDHKAEITGLAFHPTTRLLLSCDKSGRVFAEGTSPRGLGEADPLSWTQGIAVSPDGRLFLRLREQVVEVWRFGNEMTLLAELKGHEDTVRAVAISPDGRFALTGGDDRTVRLWRLPGGGAADAEASEGPRP